MLEKITYKGKEVRVTRDSNGVLGKLCSQCKEFKDCSAFCVIFEDGKHYLQCTCKECKNSYLKKKRRENREYAIFNSIKHRATRQGWDFDLVQSDIVFPEYCPILGIPLDKTIQNIKQDDTPSVDRVDNNKGYTKDNIVICSWRANKIKTNASFEEIEKIYLFMKNFLGK